LEKRQKEEKPMTITRFEIEGLVLFQPRVYQDNRGYFLETYQDERYQDHLKVAFVQDNLSMSHKGVLRGLHFQKPPHAQGKLVQVLRGSVLDVVVDLRVKSPTFGKHQVVELNDANHAQFYIPVGFAHGFIALSNDTLFSYKCTSYYSASHEQTLLWSDPELGIEWPEMHKIISDKDQIGLPLHQLDSPF
jgi:dTDP-4-dehydrorhamnose 3,5-epimerase